MSTANLAEPVWAVTPEKLQELTRRIVETAQPSRIILFGSRARGDASADSDVDLVVVKKEAQDRYAEMVALQRAIRGLILAVDILVIGEKEYEEWSETPGSVYYQARQEGEVIYEAA